MRLVLIERWSAGEFWRLRAVVPKHWNAHWLMGDGEWMRVVTVESAREDYNCVVPARKATR